MQKSAIKFENLKITPYSVHLYVPPILWKGDRVGHIGERDVFFFVLEGECFLSVDAQSYIVKKGQLAFLPKGKMRMYTQASENFSMYEMRFSAKVNGDKNLMEVLGLTEQNFVVDVENVDELMSLFENSNRDELFKNLVYDVAWCANIINIIKIYAEQRQKQNDSDYMFFRPVFEYMTINLAKQVKLEELASIVHMHPTYFVKKFGEKCGMPPLAYLNNIRMYKAMSLLAGTDDSIEKIAKSVGIADASYFARMFKKHTGISPTEYKNIFK